MINCYHVSILNSDKQRHYFYSIIRNQRNEITFYTLRKFSRYQHIECPPEQANENNLLPERELNPRSSHSQLYNVSLHHDAVFTLCIFIVTLARTIGIVGQAEEIRELSTKDQSPLPINTFVAHFPPNFMAQYVE